MGWRSPHEGFRGLVTPEGSISAKAGMTVARNGPDSPNVLIVDDEPTILLTLSHCLQGRGARVTRCRERSAAEEALEQGDYDLAIIDLCLSGGGRPDGLELVRAASRQIQGRTSSSLRP